MDYSEHRMWIHFLVTGIQWIIAPSCPARELLAINGSVSGRKKVSFCKRGKNGEEVKKYGGIVCDVESVEYLDERQASPQQSEEGLTHDFKIDFAKKSKRSPWSPYLEVRDAQGATRGECDWARKDRCLRTNNASLCVLSSCGKFWNAWFSSILFHFGDAAFWCYLTAVTLRLCCSCIVFSLIGRLNNTFWFCSGTQLIHHPVLLDLSCQSISTARRKKKTELFRCQRSLYSRHLVNAIVSIAICFIVYCIYEMCSA